MQYCANPLTCAEASTANLEGAALEKLYKKKGSTCLQCLRSLTCCIALANLSLCW